MASQIGGMRNVKVFVLYLLENINYPLDFVSINDIVMQTDYIVYLDFAEAFHEMIDLDLIREVKTEDETLYEVTEKGRCVARELNGDILSTILDQSLAMALRYLDFKKRNVVTKCEIEKLDGDKYKVTASFMEKGELIFSQSLIVDTLNRAQRMKDNFYERPEAIYRGVLALMAGNVNYLFD